VSRETSPRSISAISPEPGHGSGKGRNRGRVAPPGSPGSPGPDLRGPPVEFVLPENTTDPHTIADERRSADFCFTPVARRRSKFPPTFHLSPPPPYTHGQFAPHSKVPLSYPVHHWRPSRRRPLGTARPAAETPVLLSAPPCTFSSDTGRRPKRPLFRTEPGRTSSCCLAARRSGLRRLRTGRATTQTQERTGRGRPHR